MRGKPYLDWRGKFALDVLAYADKLPKDQQERYFKAIESGLKAISEGRINSVNKAIEVLQE